MSFELLKTDSLSRGRRGRLVTQHGIVETPIFMPVGTQGTVKAMTPDELCAVVPEIILGNTYHLFVRPGLEVIQHFGGLHRFMSWNRPILTDSGGYQVFSLAKLRRITEEGVHFNNHIDGSPCFLSPEVAMEIQATFGSDVAMAFDECTPYPCEEEYASASLERTLRWARRCRTWIADQGNENRPLLFGIAQGATYRDLSEKSARALVGMEFDGYAIGGVSVGEPESEMMRAIEFSEPFLPAGRTRYAMGLGTPPQMGERAARGDTM